MAILLQDFVTEQAKTRPESVALVFEEKAVTYGELEKKSNQLAWLLRDMGCAKGDRVVLLMPKSTEAILSMIGILKAGCIYVPIDPSSPAARIGKVLDSCQPASILTTGSLAEVLTPIPSPDREKLTIISWLREGELSQNGIKHDVTRHDLDAYSEESPNVRVRPDEPAHILFTSGSTGSPKGVIISHASVLHFVQWANTYFTSSSEDRNSGHSPLFFDLSTYDIYGTFASGASLYPVRPELNLLPHKLAEFIRDHELTKWFSVPSVLNYMAKFDVVKANDFPSLRRILWCGEAFPTPSLRYWMQKLPRVTFTNLYGPTETTIASSYYTVPVCPPHDKVEIPIGRPCPDEELFVLDEKMCSVAPGETGDLYICGVGLSTGYWKNPDTTAKVFLKNPLKPEANDMIYKTGDLAKVDEEGLIYYVGRCDAQIKSRGYRIELGEIEAGLHSFEELRESAVVAIPTGGFESHQICCAYVAQEGKEVTPLFLRKRLSTLLPPYMIPSRFREFSQLPRTANGKIDCRFLREEFAHNETETRHRGYRGSLSADVR